MRCLKARILYLLATHNTKQPRTSGVIISKLVFPSLQDRDLLGLLLLDLLEGNGQHSIL